MTGVGMGPVLGLIGTLASSLMPKQGGQASDMAMQPLPAPPAPAVLPTASGAPPSENTISPDAGVDAEAAHQQSLKRRVAKQAAGKSLLEFALEVGASGNKGLLGE